jgi:penicillin-binding protein 1A
MALVIVGGIVFAALLLVTPSVGDAPRLISKLASAHNAAQADRSSPPRFLAALQAIQDGGRGSRNGSTSDVREFVGQLFGSPARQKLTVDQRLASMLYLHRGKGQIAKIERAVLVLKLHWSYSESTLLGMYAAIASFGHGYYGLTSASCGYFGQRPGHLSWAQMALLAAAAMNPATDDPYEHFAHAKHDQAAVLRALAAAGAFSDVEVGKLAQEPLHLQRLAAIGGSCSSRHISGVPPG